MSTDDFTPSCSTRIPDQPLGADLLALDELREGVDLLARVGGAARGGESRDVFCVVEDLEAVAFRKVGEVGELHAEAQVGFVRTVFLHRLDPRHTAQRLSQFDAHYLPEHVLGPALENLQHVFLLDERHLAVDLCELGLAVGAQVFVAEAAHDLEILVVAGDHQQLFEGLRRLGQGIELVGVHAAGDDEVAGAFGRRVDQIGGFDLEEAFRVEEAADFLRHLVPQDHVALQRRAAQVEVAVFHAQVVAAVRNLFDRERGNFGFVEYGHLLGGDLDVAGCHPGIFRLPLDDLADHLDDPFAAHAACRLAGFGGRVLLDDDLSNAVAVAQVDEGHGAEVPHFLHPSGEGDGLVYVFGSQAAARMGSVHRGLYFLFVLSLQPAKLNKRSEIRNAGRDFYLARGVPRRLLRGRIRRPTRPFVKVCLFLRKIPEMEEQRKTDEKFMRLALNEARKALNEQEVPIGAVVVADGAVVGRGHNLVETLSDPTAHAEMQALTAAASTLGGKYLQGCTLYVTVEPCIMCAGAIGWAQVGRVVWGADDPKKGYRRYSEAVFHPKTTVVRGILGGECEALMTSFFAGLRD